MQKYLVSITETVNKIIEIESESEKEALNIAENKYYSGTINLFPSDYYDLNFKIKSD